MDRAELIEAVAKRRFPGIVKNDGEEWAVVVEMTERWLDAVEPVVRADERATIKYEMGVLQWEGLRLRQERADLRAKVTTLPGWGTTEYIFRGDVLALLDGAE
jgi:hypothetical protein